MKKWNFIGLFVLMGCVSSAKGNHYTIRCVDRTAACHDKARELCPDGYQVTNRVRPQKSGRDTVFTVNVRCRRKATY